MFSSLMKHFLWRNDTWLSGGWSPAQINSYWFHAKIRVTSFRELIATPLTQKRKKVTTKRHDSTISYFLQRDIWTLRKILNDDDWKDRLEMQGLCAISISTSQQFGSAVWTKAQYLLCCVALRINFRDGYQNYWLWYIFA